MRFQAIAPKSPARIRLGVTMSVRMIPFWIAFATSSPAVNAAVKLKNAAQITAARGLSTRVPTLVEGVLDLVVQILPLDHLERVTALGEELAHRLVIHSITFFLEGLEPFADGVDVLGVFHVADAFLHGAGCTGQHFSQHHRRRTRFLDPEYRRASRRSIDQVYYVVQLRRERVNVLAVERSDEGSIDAVDDVVGEIVRFVLELLDLRHLGLELARTLE